MVSSQLLQTKHEKLCDDKEVKLHYRRLVMNNIHAFDATNQQNVVSFHGFTVHRQTKSFIRCAAEGLLIVLSSFPTEHLPVAHHFCILILRMLLPAKLKYFAPFLYLNFYLLDSCILIFSDLRKYRCSCNTPSSVTSFTH